MSENKQPSAEKALEYWKDNAKEDYITTPISVLRYIGELEAEIKELKEENNLIRNALIKERDSYSFLAENTPNQDQRKYYQGIVKGMKDALNLTKLNKHE